MTASPHQTPEPDPAAVRWRVVRSTGSADGFHRRDPDPSEGHQLWLHTTPGPALILGSTQPDELVRAERARADGFEVCRRRSGGGLVALDPTTDCWIDAIIPAGSPLWEVDVGLAFHWLGQQWAVVLNDALGSAGPALVHRPDPGSARPTRPLWCFSGLGHGEVSIGAWKVVGLSQRRTRTWIRLQTLVMGRWPGRRLLPYLDLDVARSLSRPGGSGLQGQADEIDPSRVQAGPPPGIRLPAPDLLARSFVDRLGAVPDPLG